MDSLFRKILSDPLNRWVFSSSKTEVFLVGGYLRDLLMKQVSRDIDYVLNNPEALARKTAKKFKGTFITLKKNKTYRIAIKKRQFIDFTALEDSIEKNLGERDFTINAMAWSPDRGIIDPYKGEKDLKNRMIRTIFSSNLGEDPLRVLRAYRHASQTGFVIEKKTRRDLSKYAKDLPKVAPERITEEIIKILNTGDADITLKNAFKDGVLESIIKVNSRRLKENLRLLTKYKTFVDKIDKQIKRPYLVRKARQTLRQEIGQGLTRNGLIKLSILFTDGKSALGRNRPLRTCTAIKKRLRDINNSLGFTKGRITDKRLYEIFSAAGNSSFEIAIILSLKKGVDSDRFISKAEEFRKQREHFLLTGNDIMKALGIGEGVFIGRIQMALQEARFLERVKTKVQAKAWIRSNLT